MVNHTVIGSFLQHVQSAVAVVMSLLRIEELLISEERKFIFIPCKIFD